MGRIERLRFKVEALARTKRDLRKTEAALAEVQERYDTLVGRLRAARPDEAPPMEETQLADRPMPAWALVAGLVVFTAGMWFRRRLGRTAIPDFVPDELVRDAPGAAQAADDRLPVLNCLPDPAEKQTRREGSLEGSEPLLLPPEELVDQVRLGAGQGYPPIAVRKQGGGGIPSPTPTPCCRPPP